MQETEIRDTFCERLRKRREALNITRKEFAGEIGVSVAAVGMYETGDRLPPLPVLVQIARVLHTSPDELIGYTVDALPEYERHKRYLESIGMKVIECDGGKIDVIPVDGYAHVAPLFNNKDEFCTFMQTAKRNADKDTRDALKIETLNALDFRAREVEFCIGVWKVVEAFPDSELREKGGKFRLGTKVASFIGDFFATHVPPMQEWRGE